ncbi:MAG: molybdopterin-guanine dinucleotide biosynthesis protein B, partial [Pseudomonadota bacterium]
MYGIIGWKNAGKTSLMERLVAEIARRGFSVSTIKHVHHDVDLDQPGKDSYRHRAAGAHEVILASAHRFALMAEHRGPEPDLGAVLARLSPVDLVLVEGYKRDDHAKIEVFRAQAGHALIQPGDPTVQAVATDAGLAGLSVPVLDLNDTAAVADFVLRQVGLTPRDTAAPKPDFDTVAIVDWSARSAPSPARPSRDAIWIGVCRNDEVVAAYHRTRAQAEQALVDLIAAERAAGRRLLIGFDFPFGYPRGFAARLTGTPHAPAIWAWFAARITDGPDNSNNRFRVAADMNLGLGGPGPFWGRPDSAALDGLSARRTADYAALGLAERREVETLVRGASPVWKLYTTGSVGSQTLIGLPMIHRFAQRPDVAVWPFEPVTAAPVVIAEVYPSLIAPAVRASGDAIPDRAQVTLLARALWRLARTGRMASMMQVPDVAREEGWILGAGHQ